MPNKAKLVLAAAFLFATMAHADTLATVKKRGFLICGTNSGLAGFAMPDGHGNWSGLNVDYCRALAAAIFHDVSKVQFVPLATKERLSALQSGTVDVLADNTTWTLSRESTHGLLFAGTIYFDGQGFMAHKKLNAASALELSGTTICFQQGTTSELNLADFFHANTLTYKPAPFASADDAIKAYEKGACDAYTSDMSELYARRAAFSEKGFDAVLPEIISKEPLGPVVRSSDGRWFTIARWVLFALINAEELGVTSKNVDEMAKSESPDVRRLLGFEGNSGETMGLDAEWAYHLIKLVGNYGEIFDHNLGDGSPLKINRGLNALWTKGGLLYAPPLR